MDNSVIGNWVISNSVIANSLNQLFGKAKGKAKDIGKYVISIW